MPFFPAGNTHQGRMNRFCRAQLWQHPPITSQADTPSLCAVLPHLSLHSFQLSHLHRATYAMHAITVKTQLAKVDFLQYTSVTMQRGGFGKVIDKLKCIEMKYWETEKSGTKTDKEFRENRLSWIGKELKKKKTVLTRGCHDNYR